MCDIFRLRPGERSCGFCKHEWKSSCLKNNRSEYPNKYAIGGAIRCIKFKPNWKTLRRDRKERQNLKLGSIVKVINDGRDEYNLEGIVFELLWEGRVGVVFLDTGNEHKEMFIYSELEVVAD